MTNLLFPSLVLSLILSIESRMVYRRYEKQHPEKNYTEIVEIFDTVQRPPIYSESEKSLNDFLAKDAFKTDMNCTAISSTTKMTTTRAYPTTTASPTITKPPNLDNLFTIKPTRSTIRPNPKENENPDYTELYNYNKKPNIQVTKYRPSSIRPYIVIKETDVQTIRSQTDKNRVESTTVSDDYDEEIDEYYGSENGSNEEYDENNYELVTEDDLLQGVDENYDESDYEMKRRRKRLNQLNRRRKHIQKGIGVISKP